MIHLEVAIPVEFDILHVYSASLCTLSSDDSIPFLQEGLGWKFTEIDTSCHKLA
jgi:hypothetical protein